MESESKVIVTGIVTKTDFNANILDIIRPAAEITVYSQEDKEWIDKIYLIFAENVDARRFKAFNIGDILLLTGELIYYPGTGYAIYVTSYTILQSNKSDAPLNMQKTLFFNYTLPQNFVFVKGSVLCHNNDIITLAHQICTPVRGDLIKKSVQPVRITRKMKDASKNVIFCGRFGVQMIEGDAYEVV